MYREHVVVVFDGDAHWERLVAEISEAASDVLVASVTEDKGNRKGREALAHLD